jgi:hypothetical protein
MNQIAAQLRSVKHRESAGALSADQKLVGKRAVLTAIGGNLEGAPGVSLRASYLLWLSHSFISRPVAIGVAGFVLAGSGLMTTVNAAQESLPGDVLYSVKRINERAQLQIASLDRRAVLHTEFAQRRLREIERLQSDSSTRDTSIVTETMNAYTQEVASANHNLRELQASGGETTVATANQVDQNLATLNTTIANTSVPLTSTDGSLAVSSALSTTQVAQEDVITVAVEANDHEDTAASEQDLQEMFMRQFGEITTRKAFDDHRISVVRSSLKQHKRILESLRIASESDLARLERSMDIAIADVMPAMDAFRSGEHRSAFDALKRADVVLRGIEAAIAEMETAIISALMETPVEDVQETDSELSSERAGAETQE